jgi:hypothetical protein
MGFLSGDASTNATDSAPAEILCVGYGCFILVVIAPYTANLAAFLTVAVQSSSYTDIPDAIAKGTTIYRDNAIKLSFEKNNILVENV